MKKKRKNDFIQLAVLVLLGLSVILSIILPQVTRQPKEPQILSVSILIRDTDSSLWTNTRLGMDQAADELGAELRFLTLTTPDDAAEQGELLRREMENGADAAVIVPADPDAIASVLSSSAEVCPIVSMESPVEGASGTIFADPVQLGTELAQALLADWTSGRVLLLDSGGGVNHSITARLEAARSVLEDAGVPVAERACQSAGLSTGLRSLLAETGSQWVMAFDAPATLRAAEGKELEQLSVPLYGVGSPVETITRLEQGTISAVATWSDYAAGYLAVEHAVSAARGKDRATAPLSFSILRGEDIYEPNNQKMLFPVAS